MMTPLSLLITVLVTFSDKHIRRASNLCVLGFFFHVLEYYWLAWGLITRNAVYGNNKNQHVMRQIRHHLGHTTESVPDDFLMNVLGRDVMILSN